MLDVRLGVALTAEELDAVYTVATRNRTTASEMVRALIRRFLIQQHRTR